MSSYGEGDGGRFSRCGLGERIRTFVYGETEGTGTILLACTAIPATRNPDVTAAGGDFNCVLSGMEATGHPNHSRALQELIRGFDLMDMRQAPQGRDIYTHYTSQEASRNDRIYASRDLRGNKRGVETRAAAFTDHLAVVLRMTFSVTTMLADAGSGG
jgi:endonuclease/exonuclease/phosphatase family metal-dependent hydrolase